MSDTTETLEFAGPVNDGWYRTQIPDWISLNPDLKDGAFRLYCILRALILEKQKNRIRVLSHEQIAFLTVGKNGKPASISTIKALLANLQEVGLVSNPDGSRIVTSSGPGTIQSRRRYQLADWPQAPSEYAGWRNAFDKLDAFTDDWRDSRTDVSRGRLEGQKSDLDSQNSDGHGQKTDLDGQKSGENPAPTSEDAPSLKELPEGDALTSSSSAPVTPEPEPAPAPATKKTRSPEQIVIERLGCTEDEATKTVTYINQQGDGHGGRIRSLARWVENRDIHTLRQDLAMVRGAQTAGGVSYDKDPGKYLRSINGNGYKPYQNPVDQSVYDEPLLPAPKPRRANDVVGGSRTPVADHAFYSQHTDDELKARFFA